MANANSVSILDSYLVPGYQSDILVMSDKNKTAGMFLSGTRQSVLTQGSLNVIYNSLIDAVEPTTIKSAFPRNAAEKDVASRWLDGQDGISIQAEAPRLSGVSTIEVKAGQSIDGGNAGTVPASENGKAYSRQVTTSQGTTRVTWFEADTSLIDCGVPLIKDAMAISNLHGSSTPNILPEQKLSTASNSCGACGACGVCILCLEANVGIGIGALAALTFLDSSAAAIRTKNIAG